MGLDVAGIESTGFETAPQRAPRSPRAPASAPAADALDLSAGELPDSPPAEVLDAIGATGRVVRELHAEGRELRFVPPSESGEERVRIEVRDLDGNVLRTIPPSQALDLSTGTPLE